MTTGHQYHFELDIGRAGMTDPERAQIMREQNKPRIKQSALETEIAQEAFEMKLEGPLFDSLSREDKEKAYKKFFTHALPQDPASPVKEDVGLVAAAIADGTSIVAKKYLETLAQVELKNGKRPSLVSMLGRNMSTIGQRNVFLLIIHVLIMFLTTSVATYKDSFELFISRGLPVYQRFCNNYTGALKHVAVGYCFILMIIDMYLILLGLYVAPGEFVEYQDSMTYDHHSQNRYRSIRDLYGGTTEGKIEVLLNVGKKVTSKDSAYFNEQISQLVAHKKVFKHYIYNDIDFLNHLAVELGLHRGIEGLKGGQLKGCQLKGGQHTPARSIPRIPRRARPTFIDKLSCNALGIAVLSAGFFSVGASVYFTPKETKRQVFHVSENAIKYFGNQMFAALGHGANYAYETSARAVKYNTTNTVTENVLQLVGENREFVSMGLQATKVLSSHALTKARDEITETIYSAAVVNSYPAGSSGSIVASSVLGSKAMFLFMFSGIIFGQLLTVVPQLIKILFALASGICSLGSNSVEPAGQLFLKLINTSHAGLAGLFYFIYSVWLFLVNLFCPELEKKNRAFEEYIRAHARREREAAQSAAEAAQSAAAHAEEEHRESEASPQESKIVRAMELGHALLERACDSLERIEKTLDKVMTKEQVVILKESTQEFKQVINYRPALQSFSRRSSPRQSPERSTAIVLRVEKEAMRHMIKKSATDFVVYIDSNLILPFSRMIKPEFHNVEIIQFMFMQYIALVKNIDPSQADEHTLIDFFKDSVKEQYDEINFIIR